jgi:DNA-binding MarR family transcriptional regulator
MKPANLDDDDFRRLLVFRDGLRTFLRWSENEAHGVGLTAPQHQLLLAVRGHVGEPSIRDIADHLLVRHHSAVELVDRTERLGLVRRETDGDDQRVVRVSLTAAGEAKLNALTAAHLEELSRLRSRLTALWHDLPEMSEPVEPG